MTRQERQQQQEMEQYSEAISSAINRRWDVIADYVYVVAVYDWENECNEYYIDYETSNPYRRVRGYYSDLADIEQRLDVHIRLVGDEVVGRIETISLNDVMRACVVNNWYTCGTTRDYDKMLDIVRGYNATRPDNPESYVGSRLDGTLHKLAVDIKDHSDTDDSVVEIMTTLHDYAVDVVYVDRNDD